MPNSQADSNTEERPRERTELDRKYGNIGISAVAAACRYQTAPKTPAATTLVPRDDESADAVA